MKFKEFEPILKQTINEFKEIDKFGFIGISGSLDTKRDLDIMIAPNENIKLSTGDYTIFLAFVEVICLF